MDVKNPEIYHTILQNQDHCLKIELKNCFSFEVIGTDYAGSFFYNTINKSELKAYILPFFVV